VTDPTGRAGTAGTAARDEVLRRVRQALSGAADPGPFTRDYRRAGALPAAQAEDEAEAEAAHEVVELLRDRLVDYRASVHVIGAAGAVSLPRDAGVAAGVARIVAGHAGPAARMVVAEDFPLAWRAGWDAVVDLGLGHLELDALDGAVTTCALAIAETGTLVLDGGPGQGRRAITLVPDLHVCLVRRADIVRTVPDAIARLEPQRPLTFISGPSATSDIELQRVEGVHGPRRLHVLIVD
jgi:L-lactate dehydrogenase complex protein LldG